MTIEEKNMFRDAKFGDKFLTRNGQVVVYQKQAREDVYCLFDEESDCVIEYRPNGDVIHEYTGNVEPQEDDIVKKYVQPSLSANLDDVKLDISDIVDCGYKGIAEFFYNRGKRAGAEWMAGQFQKIEGNLVDWYSTSDGKDYCCGVKTDGAFEVPEGFYIRKK